MSMSSNAMTPWNKKAPLIWAESRRSEGDVRKHHLRAPWRRRQNPQCTERVIVWFGPLQLVRAATRIVPVTLRFKVDEQITRMLTE